MIDETSKSPDAALDSILSNLHRQAVGMLYSKTVPTTVPDGKLVIYDDGAGTKRLYVKTGLGNLGYVALT